MQVFGRDFCDFNHQTKRLIRAECVRGFSGQTCASCLYRINDGKAAGIKRTLYFELANLLERSVTGRSSKGNWVAKEKCLD